MAASACTCCASYRSPASPRGSLAQTVLVFDPDCNYVLHRLEASMSTGDTGGEAS